MSPTARVRRFNRFYTGQIGVLRKSYLNTPFSLTEARVIYEVATRQRPAASAIARDLGLDAGHLSRLLLRFERRGLLSRKPSAGDARVMQLALTAEGRRAFNQLDRGSEQETSRQLGRLSEEDRERLLGSMQNIEAVLGENAAPAPVPAAETIHLRTHQPGDMGWVIHRHGVLYQRESGWGALFEALVAEVAARFLREYDAERERCWIAEMDGRKLGSVFLVRAAEYTAQLRLLLVEPEARGLGLGRRMVDACIGFARQAGYRKLILWTQASLAAAHHIYRTAGFRLIEERPHWEFGVEVLGQMWEMDL